MCEIQESRRQPISSQINNLSFPSILINKLEKTPISFNITKNSKNRRNITYLSLIQSFAAGIQRFPKVSLFFINLEIYCVLQIHISFIFSRVKRMFSFKSAFYLKFIIFEKSQNYIKNHKPNVVAG